MGTSVLQTTLWGWFFLAPTLRLILEDYSENYKAFPPHFPELLARTLSVADSLTRQMDLSINMMVTDL